MEGVTLHDLYHAYPEFDIDIKQEQALLSDHEIIIFHHPFFWYSTPAILKEWQDLVLEHGWAYGSTGNELKDKLCFNVMTSGGQRVAYAENGYNRFTVRQLLAPIEQTAFLCKMIYLPPFVVHGTHSITKDKILQSQKNYHQLLTLFRDEQIILEKARELRYLNDYFE